MKVNSNDTNLASQFISNGSEVKVNKPVNGKEQINSEMERLAKDIYHKDQPNEPNPIYSKPINITTNNVVSTSEDREKAINNIGKALVNLYMPGGEVSQSVEKMFGQQDNIMAEIVAEQPSLLDKDWGISVSKSGDLEATGSLNDNEKTLISEKLNDNEDFVAAAKEFKSSFLEHLGYGGGGWANYDVNEDNFSKVFDLKEILDNSQGDESFKQAWNKDFSWLELNDNISSQLRRNAELE